MNRFMVNLLDVSPADACNVTAVPLTTSVQDILQRFLISVKHQRMSHLWTSLS
jgi:hypothetical protein